MSLLCTRPEQISSIVCMTINDREHTTRCRLAQPEINQLFMFITFTVYTLHTLQFTFTFGTLLRSTLHLAIILSTPFLGK